MWKAPATLIVIVLILVSFGIVMLASTSRVKAERSFDDPNHFLKRQVMWLVVALSAAVCVSLLDYHVWRRLAWPLLAVTLVLLVLVLVPGVGMKIGGSRRWLRLGPLSFQPSEMAKVATIVLLSTWMSRVQGRVERFKEGFFVPAAVLGVVLALVTAEPDFGTTILIGAVGMAVMFLAGSRLSYLAVSGAAGLLAFALAVAHDPVRMRRMLAFLDSEKYRAAAYQVIQSKDAFVLGGGWGVGLGESMQKHFYLPEAHTDFILAIIGEELGLLATLAVVALFAGLLVCGLIISLRAPDVFGRLLGFGISTMITLQAAINVGVVTGCLPTKGLPLPFISYGGSSLVSFLVGVGILVSIGSHWSPSADEPIAVIKDRQHWF